MADFIDVHYVNMLAGRLPRFSVKHTNPFKANFRCVLCGDSQKSSSKTRGWITESVKTGGLYYSCFNCGASEPFNKFLEHYDPLMHNDYVAEKYIERTKQPFKLQTETVAQKPAKKLTTTGIKKISQLAHDHPARQYIDKRQIPTNQHFRLFYTPKFKTWVNSILPNKFEDVRRDEPRLLMPFFDQNKNMFGVSGRSFDPNGLRYITIMFDDSKPKLFGLDQVDFTEPYKVLEGAIDSLFVSNSVAMAGADGNISGLEHVENATFVFDAEPRNKEICKRMEKLLRQGYQVCIWPHNVPAKDANDMYLKGLRDITAVIEANTYSGLEGLLKFNSWKKCG